MMILRAVKAGLAFVLSPFARLYDLVRNGQADIEAVYPESFHPTGEEAALQGAVTTSLITQIHA